jgi:hypothetical protein
MFLLLQRGRRAKLVDIKGVCGRKVNGLLEMVHNGCPALVPVCDKHLEILQATPAQL